jgi:CHAT domain-containing protein
MLGCSPEELRALAGRYAALADAKAATPREDRRLGEELGVVSRALCRAVIDPLADLLFDRPSARTLTVIPDGALFEVPFGALQQGDGKYLIERLPLAYATSIAAAIRTGRLSEQRPPVKRSILAFVAPEPLPDGLPRLEIADGLSGEWVSELLDRPAGDATVVVRTGRAATAAEFKRLAGSFNVIHLWTHAVIPRREDEPTGGYIALADVRPGEGRLEMSSLVDMRLQAELVVLGACSSGRGRVGADGVLGLARAVAAAGARSLYVNLWDVGEVGSIRQIAAFSRHWIGGMGQPQALREAQMQSIRLGEDPRVWAAAVLYGP